METIRKPFQGVLNIIRFNWHFYVIAFFIVLFLIFVAKYFDEPISKIIYTTCILVVITTFISLLISFYIYDLSGLYSLNWLETQTTQAVIVNINAGFDETSMLLKDKFKNSELIILDFYDPLKHTEVSIKRARKVYPSFPKTKHIETSNLQLKDNSVDAIFVIFCAHEIRDNNERLIFLKELKRLIKPNGRIYIVEHLRDIPNFLAYNIGFFHFYSKTSWRHLFKLNNLNIKQEIKLTPFISTFILSKNGNTL
jgi:ubiquinone/menaquinone biosynthesis C-methylase UbiE